MEQIKALPHDLLVDAYLTAKNTMMHAGYKHEIKWQTGRDFNNLSESDFFREAAWVVIASGMRDSIVRKKFPIISQIFYCWKNPERVINNESMCRTQALSVFNHEGKIDAIIAIMKISHNSGFAEIKNRIKTEGIDYIDSFPFMGKATSFHLAKNIGLDVVKPDRHLCRIANAAGYNDPDELCKTISKYVDDAISVIDIVLWRYATLEKKYESVFQYNNV